MKQSQRRHFRNVGCDCRECGVSSLGWLAAIILLAAVLVICTGVLVFGRG